MNADVNVSTLSLNGHVIRSKIVTISRNMSVLRRRNLCYHYLRIRNTYFVLGVPVLFCCDKPLCFNIDFDYCTLYLNRLKRELNSFQDAIEDGRGAHSAAPCDGSRKGRP